MAMGLLDSLKKRRKKCDDKEEEPKLEDLREAINKSMGARTNDPKQSPVFKFIVKWEKLGNSWLRHLTPRDSQTLEKNLSPLEKRFISLLGGLLAHKKTKTENPILKIKRPWPPPPCDCGIEQTAPFATAPK